MWKFKKLKYDVTGVLEHQLNGIFWGQLSQPLRHQIGNNLHDILHRQFQWQLNSKIKGELNEK